MTYKSIELTVIIPCFNAEATIATQLEALAGQHYSKPWEVIVADNGSNDSSMEIVKRYEDRLPNLRIIDASARKGSYYARNAGARASVGKYLAFCDADDCVGHGWVSEMSEALSHYDVVCGHTRFDKFNNPKEAEIHASFWKEGLYREQFLPHAATCNLGIKHLVHDAIGGFDECLPRFADGDYCWRLQMEGYKLHYAPRAIVQYRIGRVNPSLSYLYHRGLTAAACDYWLYKKYKSLGITKEMILPAHRSLKRALKSWLRLLKLMPYACLRSRRTRADWLQNFAGKTGDLVGQCHGIFTNPCRESSKTLSPVISPEISQQIRKKLIKNV